MKQDEQAVTGQLTESTQTISALARQLSQEFAKFYQDLGSDLDERMGVLLDVLKERNRQQRYPRPTKSIHVADGDIRSGVEVSQEPRVELL